MPLKDIALAKKLPKLGGGEMQRRVGGHQSGRRSKPVADMKYGIDRIGYYV